METVFNAIQKTPVPVILIFAGLLFLLLGFVTKLGGMIEVSPEQKRWTIPIGLLVLAIGLVVLYFTPAPDLNTAITDPKPSPTSTRSSDPTPAETTQPAPTSAPDRLSFRDWEGSWNLQWEYEGQWYGKTMTVTSNRFGIEGNYEIGRLKGTYVNGDVSKVTGEIVNTSGTGITCPSGEQTGSFSLNLTNGGRSMAGWWDICDKGTRWKWKADKSD